MDGNWILILTLLLSGGTATPAVTVEHVPGFKNQEGCKKAGDQWMTHGNFERDTSVTIGADFVCVSVK